MFHNTQSYNAAQLPVPYDGIDPGTQNPNLPQGNDRVPQIQLTQWLHQNQQIWLYTIGLLRAVAQSTFNKSPTHCAAYNLLSQNHFNNQLWQQWCQTTADFVEFLIVAKQYQPQAATDKCAQMVYMSFLGMAYQTYPQLQQVTPHEFVPGLQQATTIYTQMMTDLRNYKNGTYNQRSFNGGGSNQLPPINFQQQQPSNYNQGLNNFQTSGYTPSFNQPAPYQGAANTSTSGSVGSSYYDEPAPAKPLVPVEEISSDNTDYFGAPIKQDYSSVQTYSQAAPVIEETDLPAPRTVDDVVMDPTYYTPSGFKLDINRPFDTIHSPGGVITRPAQLVNWEVSIGDDMPWQQIADPSRFCLFYVKFPDGIIKEKFVEWTPTMKYLDHEHDVEMRRKAYRPSGIVVSADTPISTIGGDALTEEDVVSMIQDGHLKRNAVPPVVLKTTFSGATDLEVEMTVREELQNLMEIKFDAEYPMPACEYRSTFLHPLNITEECFAELTLLSKQEDLSQVALGLRDLVTQGILPIRYYRFINDRFTRAVNDVLHDAMTLSTDITDFCDDYIDLEAHLTKKKGENMVKVLRGAATNIINKSLFLMETTDGFEEDASTVYQIADNYINIQLGWSLDDLTTPNIRTGKATLISASSHPTLLESLRGMIERSMKAEDFVAGTMRLITSEGCYLEVIKGRLVKNATLLKLVK